MLPDVSGCWIFIWLIPGDDDAERTTQAEVLLNTYCRELERQRLTASAQGLLISGEGDIRTFSRLVQGLTSVYRRRRSR